MRYVFPKLKRMETCGDWCPSLRDGRGSVSESSLRSVMCTSVRSTLTSFKILAVWKDDDEGCKLGRCSESACTGTFSPYAINFLGRSRQVLPHYVVHLSLRSARNTMGTRGTPE